MSWWSDKEKFDEYDPPQCEFCKRGNSYDECERCKRLHDEEPLEVMAQKLSRVRANHRLE